MRHRHRAGQGHPGAAGGRRAPGLRGGRRRPAAARRALRDHLGRGLRAGDRSDRAGVHRPGAARPSRPARVTGVTDYPQQPEKH